MEGQAEYVFWHALVRDVAYAQIPRVARAERHLAAAAWIERVAADRVEDQAEFLAHHYTQAMGLAAAAGQPGQAERLRGPALRFLVLAGDRTLALNVAAGSQRHARVAAGAVRLLEESGAGPEDPVAAYARMAGVALVVGDMRETIAWADRAAALGAGHGLEVPARALGFRGSARCALGDPAGLEELRAALALALDRGEGRDTAVLYNNLGDALLPIEGPAGVLATYREGIEFARRRGIGELAAAMAAGSLDRLIEVGAWDRALADAEAMADRAEAEGNVSELLLLRRAQVRVLVDRGQTGLARPLADWLVAAARESGGTEEVLGAFTVAAGGLLAAGEPDQALELLAEAAAWPHVAEASLYPACLPEMARTAAAAGDPALAQRLVAPLEPTFAYHEHALCAAGLGHPGGGGPLRQARQVFDGLGARPLAAKAEALLGRAGARA